MKQFLLKDLAGILYSDHGNVQEGVLWDRSTYQDVDSGTVDYLVENYPDVPVYRIMADDNLIVIDTIMGSSGVLI